MRLAVTITLTIIVAVAPAVRAQPPASPQLPESLTLDQSLQIFRQPGFDLLLADTAVAGAEGTVRVGGAVPNPNWQLWGSYTTPTNPGNAPWGVTAGIGDSAALEDSISGKRWLRLKVARAA